MDTARFTAWLRTLWVAAPLLLAGCTSSMGSTMPPTAPGPGGVGSSQGLVPNSAPQSRQQIASVAVPVASAAPSLQGAGPQGFGLEIDLSKPTAAPSASPAPAASGQAKPAAKPSPSPTPKPTPSPSPSPSPTGSAKPSPSPSATPKGPNVAMKFTIYPDGTQKPPGDFDSEFTRRVPILDVLVMPSTTLKLYSLAALGFVIPSAEQTGSRGFTVALYETRKFHKDRLIEDRVDAQVVNGIVRATNSKDALELSKGHEYTAILFADALAATPSAYSPPNYPGAPNFGQAQQSGNGMPASGAGQPGHAGPTPYPFATATPNDDSDDE